MLRLIIGPAGAGKTARIFEELRAGAELGRDGLTLLVPEQYSHEAERELCGAVGGALSMHARVLSFTGLARAVDEELGSGGRVPLDKGGRLLTMALALDSVGSRLSVYSGARRSPETQLLLLTAIDELKAAMISGDALVSAASGCGGALGAKLSDLALILGAYDAALGPDRSDGADRLGALLEKLPRSGFGRGGQIYIDGFTDFTAQESAVIRALLDRGAELTVCLTCDRLDGDSEVYELSRRTARALLRAAEDAGAERRVEALSDPERPGPLDAFAAHMFDYSSPAVDAEGAVSLYRADTVTSECELAAALCLSIVRPGVARWRDIAVAVRGFEDYRGALEWAFGYYGVPLFSARKADILAKPLPALIGQAYEAVLGGFESEDVIACVRTGLFGLTPDECDILENYCFTWNASAAMWRSEKDWRAHPDGYGAKYDPASLARLELINGLRRRVAGPLLAFERRVGEAGTARGQALALNALFEDLDLPLRLSLRADELERRGLSQAAGEYGRLWDLTVSALEQTVAILGDTPMDGECFSRLFLLTLSQYDVGIIPVSLDMVSAGDFDRMRRRHIKHLIVLGCSDERLPRASGDGGVFSADERQALGELGLELDAGDAELWREFSLINNCLSLPSDSLTLITPACGGEGGPVQPSFLMSRAARLFELPIVSADPRRYKTQAPSPAFELAAGALSHPRDSLYSAAEAYFERTDGARLADVRRAAAMERGRLSRDAVRELYGASMRLSASRIDKFASCRFAYFLQYGLRARARRPAAFSPPEFGAFTHYVLQCVAQEAQALGGFGQTPDSVLDRLTDRYIAEYVSRELNDFAEKSPRFRYLFERLAASVRRIVRDMAEELRASLFQPLSFELDFSALGSLADMPLPGGERLAVSGIADRVDGWVHGGRLYLRVIDYKTGRKSFSLSDVYYGLGLQMLLYLFTLEKGSVALYGGEALPAGVLYVPAWDQTVSAGGDLSDPELAEKRAKAHRRSGLLLSDPDILRAMEDSDDPRRIPVRWKDGAPSGDALASAEQLGALRRRVEETLAAMAGELKCGSIAADPYFKAAQDNACLYCDYFDACRFSEGRGGDRRRYLQRLPATRVWNILEGKEEEHNG